MYFEPKQVGAGWGLELRRFHDTKKLSYASAPVRFRKLKPDAETAVRFKLDEAGEHESEVWACTITTPTLDRYNSIIHTEGINLEEFRQNPVVYVDHGWLDGELPVGRCIALTPMIDENNPTRSKIDALFVLARGVDKSEDVRRLLNQGILGSVSIGFNTDESHVEEHETRDEDGNTFGEDIYHIDRSTLLEFSVVGLPGNTQAKIHKKPGSRAVAVSYPSSRLEVRAQIARIEQMRLMEEVTDDVIREESRALFEAIGQADPEGVHAMKVIENLSRMVGEMDPVGATVIASAFQVADLEAREDED